MFFCVQLDYMTGVLRHICFTEFKGILLGDLIPLFRNLWLDVFVCGGVMTFHFWTQMGFCSVSWNQMPLLSVRWVFRLGQDIGLCVDNVLPGSQLVCHLYSTKSAAASLCAWSASFMCHFYSHLATPNWASIYTELCEMLENVLFICNSCASWLKFYYLWRKESRYWGLLSLSPSHAWLTGSVLTHVQIYQSFAFLLHFLLSLIHLNKI